MTQPGVAAANTRAARAFLAALARCGVEDACITPGSRSTPLTFAAAEQTAIRPWLHLDERSSAFFAMGLARAKGRPVLLICTSGTAAANFLPAVVEANLSRIPLVVCTADRPPELRDVGAAQTIDQVGLYGRQVRWAVDLPPPYGVEGEVARYEAVAARAVHMAMGVLPGPVHVNFPFSEPLVAPPAQHEAPPAAAAIEPAPVTFPAVVEPSSDTVVAVSALAKAQRPLIVAGPETGGLPDTSIAHLADRLGAPILADPLSGLRTGGHDRSRVVVAYDAFLRDPRAAALRPDAVVRLGAPPTSKALNQFLAAPGIATQVLVDLPGSHRDPDATATHVVTGRPVDAAEALGTAARSEASASWCAEWRSRDDRAAAAMAAAACRFEKPFEGRIFLDLQRSLPLRSTIVAGNSMPVRDLDSFIFSDGKPLRFVANRGANGIDGVNSSALGAAAAGGEPVVLVVGDISFYHDLSGLWAARRHGLDLTIVVVNNDGGGIFHYLPQVEHARVFEEWFATPPGLDFEHAARLYGASYCRPDTWAEFACATVPAPGGGLRIVELRTDRAQNVAMHREAWAEAARASWD